MTKAASNRRLTVFYVLLVVVAAVAVVVLRAGGDKQAQPSIAGGYDAGGPNPCLGATPPPSKDLGALLPIGDPRATAASRVRSATPAQRALARSYSASPVIEPWLEQPTPWRAPRWPPA